MVTGEGPTKPAPTTVAVALSYEREKDNAPRIVAKGRGWIAESIIELARKHNVTIHRDEDLVKMLAKLDIDMPIPLEAYAAVAQIIAYIYKANEQAKRNA